MNAQQREPFENKAKEHKLGAQKGLQKYTSQGSSSSSFKKQRLALGSTQKNMKATIKEIVQKAYSNNAMGSQEYLFISGNFFVKTDNTYFPAALAIIKFTFEYGIVSKFHTFINPEKIPIGYQFDAKSWSEESHRLPIPPNAKGEKNYVLIFGQIKKFMESEAEILPMFTIKEGVAVIESFIEEFCAATGDDSSRYRVYPLHELFFYIKEQLVKNSIKAAPFGCIDIAETHLNCDRYVYVTKIACKYHQGIDCGKHCSLSIVQRWAYTFLDHICDYLNIELKAGQHFPSNVDDSLTNIADRSSESITFTHILSSVQASTIDWTKRAPSAKPQIASVNDGRWDRELDLNTKKSRTKNEDQRRQKDLKNALDECNLSSDRNGSLVVPIEINHEDHGQKFLTTMPDKSVYGWGRGREWYRRQQEMTQSFSPQQNTPANDDDNSNVVKQSHFNSGANVAVSSKSTYHYGRGRGLLSQQQQARQCLSSIQNILPSDANNSTAPKQSSQMDKIESDDSFQSLNDSFIHSVLNGKRTLGRGSDISPNNDLGNK